MNNQEEEEGNPNYTPEQKEAAFARRMLRIHLGKEILFYDDGWAEDSASDTDIESANKYFKEKGIKIKLYKKVSEKKEKVAWIMWWVGDFESLHRNAPNVNNFENKGMFSKTLDPTHVKQFLLRETNDLKNDSDHLYYRARIASQEEIDKLEKAIEFTIERHKKNLERIRN